MSVVHFATELTGGAGGFVKNIHTAMLNSGMSSFIISRERNNLKNSFTIKPINRFAGSLRARWLTILGKIGVINSSYAMFGIERCPVGLSDIQHSLGPTLPTAFIFYWISYFVNLETIHKLRQAYPQVPIAFVCLDEAFLTGGCHYSCGCLGYQEGCNNCPATSATHIKTRIKLGFRQRQELISRINPIVIYPTTNMQKMGDKSSILKNVRSAVIPLGAMSNREMSLVMGSAVLERSDRNDSDGKLKLLVRSSSEYRKGCDMFISALKGMSERIPDLRSHLEVISIGDETLAIAQINRYVNHVDMGYVQRDELMSIYQNVDAFIVTSREDAGPLMVNECVALGVFVISTPIGVAHDLIKENINGLITRNISSDAISDSLISILQNRYSTRNEMAEVSALQIHNSSLTFEGYIQTMMDIIHTN